MDTSSTHLYPYEKKLYISNSGRLIMSFICMYFELKRQWKLLPMICTNTIMIGTNASLTFNTHNYAKITRCVEFDIILPIYVHLPFFDGNISK